MRQTDSVDSDIGSARQPCMYLCDDKRQGQVCMTPAAYHFRGPAAAIAHLSWFVRCLGVNEDRDCSQKRFVCTHAHAP